MDKSQVIILRLAVAATALAVLLFPAAWIDDNDSGHVYWCFLPSLAWHPRPDEEWPLSILLAVGEIAAVWVVAAIASVVAGALTRGSRRRKAGQGAV